MCNHEVCCSLKNPNHKHWTEWNENFLGYENVRIVPQPTQSTGPERKNIHYPLVRSIAQGDLSQKGIPAFNMFDQNSTLILCNLRIPLPFGLPNVRGWKDKRPDILIISSSSDIVVVQCKPKKDIGKAEDDIKAFITVNDMASDAPIISTSGTLSDAQHKWEGLYNERYPRHLNFPDFRATLRDLFSLNTDSKINSWALAIMRNIKNNAVAYGFAFDGTFDSNTTFRLHYFSHQFNEKLGRKYNLYYFAVQRDGSFNVVKSSELHNK